MLKKLRRAKADMATMNTLLPAAEAIARADGLEAPSAEHLLLAALDLDDGIAQEALLSFGVGRVELQAAFTAQHQDALNAIGVNADDNAIAASLPAGGTPKGPYRAQGSLQTAFQAATSLAKRDAIPLNSGHVLIAVAGPGQGSVARSLEFLEVDRSLLCDRTRELVGR